MFAAAGGAKSRKVVSRRSLPALVWSSAWWGEGARVGAQKRTALSCRPVLVVHVDDVAMAVTLGHMPMRVAVRLRTLPALMLVPVMLVMRVQMLVLEGPVLVLEDDGIGRRP